MDTEKLFFPIENQIRALEKEERFADIDRAASIGDGIDRINESERNSLTKEYEEYCGEVMKFVPASGAASRMFKHVHDLSERENALVSEFLERIHDFPFISELREKCNDLYHLDLRELIANQRYQDLSDLILKPSGLNYANSPKGLVPFHKVETSLNPFQVHVNEAVKYACKNGKIQIHFTVSPSHRMQVEEMLAAYIATLNRGDITVGYSVQRPETDTVALDMAREMVRDELGNTFFRPGGHGALIYNLNEIDSDVIFIKNIDNVVKESAQEMQSRWKQILGGYLVKLSKKIFHFQRQVDEGIYSDEAMSFLSDTFGYANLSESNLKELLFRPIRVCGMVINQGQPGGGPFYVKDKNTGTSLQIVEAAELDKTNSNHIKALKIATHFNPVDIVCGVKNYKSEKYDLSEFIDKNSFFTSIKNYKGKEIKTLELPGLWNGAMANWNSVFVEVPTETFNPVKTVNDLLKESHQN
ncbi:MAG TPA: DUF4301 domain-containing protein [Flavobacteriales bacterium]|nr:DUF4301 domain-containing protein [Flavobacteriales bacterium]